MSSSRLVFERTWESEYIPEDRTSSGYLVNVPTRVDERDGVVNIIEDVTAIIWDVILSGSWKLGWKWSWWWEGEVCVEVIIITTRCRLVVNLSSESVVEREKTSPIIGEGYSRYLILNSIIGCRGIVNHGSLKVEVIGVIGVEHGISNVWDKVSSIGLSCDENLTAFKIESIHEVFPEP